MTLQIGEVPILYGAIQAGQKDVALKLLEKGYNYKYIVDDMTPIMHAIEKRQYEVFKKLLSLGADISYYDRHTTQAIHYASQKGVPIEYLKGLVEAGAEVNAKTAGNSIPLIVATIQNDIEKVEYLCQQGADATMKSLLDKTALNVATTDEMKAALATCKKQEGGKKKYKKTKKNKKLNRKKRLTRTK